MPSQPNPTCLRTLVTCALEHGHSNTASWLQAAAVVKETTPLGSWYSYIPLQHKYKVQVPTGHVYLQVGNLKNEEVERDLP